MSYALATTIGPLRGVRMSESGPSAPVSAAAASRKQVRRLRLFDFETPMLFAAAQGESAHPRGDEAGDVADDDPPKIATFEDFILKEKLDEVEPLLRSYLANHPRSWKAYYFLGYVLLRQRRIGDSITAAAKSLELNVNNAESHKLLGRDLSIIGRYDLATREFREALRLSPNSPEIHYNLGRVYAAQDDFLRAREELEKAIQLDSNYMEAYNALGFAMEALLDEAAALKNYQAAIRLNEERHGKFDSPYVNLSGFYNNQGKLDLAVEYANQALQLNPQSDLAYFQLAKACRVRQDWKGETEALEKAIAIKPWSSEYHYVLATAYRKLGKIKESQQALETFRELERKNAEIETERREARRRERGLESRPEE